MIWQMSRLDIRWKHLMKTLLIVDFPLNQLTWKPTGLAILPRQRHHPQGHQASLRPVGEVNKIHTRGPWWSDNIFCWLQFGSSASLPSHLCLTFTWPSVKRPPCLYLARGYPIGIWGQQQLQELARLINQQMKKRLTKRSLHCRIAARRTLRQSSWAVSAWPSSCPPSWSTSRSPSTEAASARRTSWRRRQVMDHVIRKLKSECFFSLAVASIWRNQLI